MPISCKGFGQLLLTGSGCRSAQVGSAVALNPDRPLQCLWFGPISSLRRERNTLSIGELFEVL